MNIHATMEAHTNIK